MYVCDEHDCAHITHECPACACEGELEDLRKDLTAYEKEVSELQDELSNLQAKIDDLEAKEN